MSFAEQRVVYDGSQENVVKPPQNTLNVGFIPAHTGNRGQSLPANWLNWLFRDIYRKLSKGYVVSDASGAAVFTQPDTLIELTAVDRTNPTKYIVAVGYKPASGVHTLNVVKANGLALGTATIAGDQPVTGGVDVVLIAESKGV